MNRRELLAFVALADAPMPYRVYFRLSAQDTAADSLRLSCEQLADVDVWAALFGLGNPDTWTDDEGMIARYATGKWRGIEVNVFAEQRQRKPEPPLPNDAREPLQQLVDQAGEPAPVPQQRDGSES